MTQPLALLYYEKLFPGSQLLNRLEDMGYRVQTTSDVDSLKSLAREAKPLVVFLDLRDRQGKLPAIIQLLREGSDTAHLPVIAFAAERETELQESARKAGATIVVNEGALLQHLDHFMEQALQID